MKSKTVCFTGHRIIPENERETILKKLEDTLVDLAEMGYENFIAGGALGFDTLAEEKIIKIKNKYPKIRLVLALPCMEQTKRWTQSEKIKYEEIKRQADEIVYTSENYSRGCMFKRNRYMVDRSGVCVCYLTKESGGTAYTVKYAKSQDLIIISL